MSWPGRGRRRNIPCPPELDHPWIPGGQSAAGGDRAGRLREAGQVEVVDASDITVPAEGVADVDARLERPMEPFFDGEHSLRLLAPEEAASGSVMPGAAGACADLHQMVQ